MKNQKLYGPRGQMPEVKRMWRKYTKNRPKVYLKLQENVVAKSMALLYN